MRLLVLLLALTASAYGQFSIGAVRSPQNQTYFMATTGNDSNAGTAVSPWLTPNHALNCGDVIQAASGTYSASNFASGKWGAVTCNSTSKVAWLICATFDACKISAGANYGMYVSSSYWGVQGWEVTTSASGFTCFAAAPAVSGPVNIHHIVFANNIANGCGGGGLSGFNNGTHSVDYIAFVANIAYNAAQNSLNCYSGMTVFQPLASDTVAGTHIYVGGNFAWNNRDPSGCASGANNGGAGFIEDTDDGSQGLGVQYGQQEYVVNNLFVGNDSSGLESQTYTTNPAVHSTAYWRNNTIWGNLLGGSNTNLCAEMLVNKAYGINADHNIAQPNTSSACTGHTTYASYAYDTSDGVHYSAVSTIANNWLYGPAGITGVFNDESPTPNTFTFGINSAGSTPVSPGFAAPAVPGAPSAGSAMNVVDYMTTSGVIANFTPTTSGTAGFGYQAISSVNGTDALFPHWLCGVGNLNGLVTPSC